MLVYSWFYEQWVCQTKSTVFFHFLKTEIESRFSVSRSTLYFWIEGGAFALGYIKKIVDKLQRTVLIKSTADILVWPSSNFQHTCHIRDVSFIFTVIKKKEFAQSVTPKLTWIVSRHVQDCNFISQHLLIINGFNLHCN